MARLGLVLIIVGGFLGYTWWQERSVASLATAEPKIVSLADLEKSPETDNYHLKVQEHVRVYPLCVYEYEQGKYETGDPTDSTKVNHCYYPIISKGHPWITQIDALVAKYGSLQDVPDEVKLPDLETFAVLVKTNGFHSIGAIPNSIDDSDEIQGCVINRMSPLKSDEKRLLSESFPKMNWDTVFILEEGKKPMSSGKSLLMMGGAILLLVLGLGALIVGAKGN